MSEFEFSRSLMFGAQLPLHSPVRRLDPRTRLLLVIFLLVGLSFARNLLVLLLTLVVILALWLAARAPLNALLQSWRKALPFLLILALLQILFGMGRESPVLLRVGPLVVNAASLAGALSILLRFSAFILALNLAVASLSTPEVTGALDSLLRPLAVIGLPANDFVMVVQVTLRFFPLLAQTAERIAKSQASRGADWRPAGWNLAQRARQIAPLIVPLFVTSLRRAENVALAMDARAYGSMPLRTSMLTLRFRAIDYGTLAAGLLVTALLLAL